MPKLKLSCPHCGYSKEVQRDLIPHEEVRLKCPKCAESFVFNVKEAELAAEAEERAAASEAEPSAPAVPEPAPPPPADAGEEGDERDEKVRAVCPTCGFFRKISADLIPPEGKRMKCPRCKGTFTVGGPEAESEEAPTLAGGAEPPETAENVYGEHGIGELSGHLGEPLAGMAQEEPVYSAEPVEEEGLFEGELGSPKQEETFPPEPEYQPEYGEAGVGDLSGHIEPILVEEEEEESSGKYHPARNIPQADTTDSSEDGYRLSVPGDLLEAAEAVPEEEIEVVPQEEERPAVEEAEVAPPAGYKEGRSERPRSGKDHGFAVMTDFDEFLKVPPPPSRAVTGEGPEVEMLGTEPSEGEGLLVSVSDLLRETWMLLRSRASTFIPLVLVAPVFILSAMGLSYGISYLFSALVPAKAFSIQTAGLAFGLYFSAYLLSWWAAALLKAISDETISSSESFSMTKPVAGAFLWLFFICTLITAGGYLLFIIPGILMSVWFAFSFYILVDEDERGLAAMIKSREYVRGHWVGVLWRLMVVWFIPTVIVALKPFLAVAYLFYLPFPVAYTFLLYLDLKGIKGPVKITPNAGSKLKYVVIGLIGLLTPILGGGGLFYSGMLGRLDKTYGLDTRTLLAEITGEDDDVRQVYEDYRKALLAGDYTGVSKTLTDDYLTRLGSRSNNIIQYKKSLSPSKPVKVNSIDFDNLDARLSLECLQDDGVLLGNALLVKRLGNWYIDNEDWSLNVRPRPAALRGGGPAPEFGPVDVGFITPGPGYGGKGASPFYDSGRKIKPLVTLTGHKGGVNKVRFLPDSRRLVSISDGDRTVRLWNAVAGRMLSMKALPYTPVGMDVTPDGSEVVVSDSYGNFAFIQVNETSLGDSRLMSADIGAESRIAISPNGLLLATASSDRLVTIWDLAARKRIAVINTPEPMRELAFSPAGDILAVSSATSKFTLFSLENGNGRTYTVPEVDKNSDVSCIDIGPHGRYLVTGHMDSSITEWEISAQKPLFNFFVKNAAALDVKFCPDGGCYATSQQDSNIYIWETVTAGKLATLEGGKGTQESLSFSPDGSLLASGGSDNQIIIWGTSLPVAKKALKLAEETAAARPIRTTGRASASLGLEKSTFATGEDIRVGYSAGYDFKDDAWIGVVPSDVPHGDEVENDDYDISGMILEGSLSGTLTLKAPERPGEYDIRMFTSDQGGVEAAHLSIVVK